MSSNSGFHPVDPVPARPPRSPSGPPPSPEVRRDVEAAYAARAELGPDYDDSIAAGLADRVEQLVAYRTAELRHQSSHRSTDQELERTSQRQRFVLGIVSLSVGVPITAISASEVQPGLLGVVAAWAGIVGVNLAAAWRGGRGR